MFLKELNIGLGEAIKRLLVLEQKKITGMYTNREEELKELKMIFDALNKMKINLNFECEDDVMPEKNIDIFKKSVEDNCCRITEQDEIKNTTSNRISSSRKKK